MLETALAPQTAVFISEADGIVLVIVREFAPHTAVATSEAEGAELDGLNVICTLGITTVVVELDTCNVNALQLVSLAVSVIA